MACLQRVGSEAMNKTMNGDPPEKKAEVPKSMDPGKAKVTLIRNGYPLVKSAKKAAGFSRSEETKGSRAQIFQNKGIKLQPSL